MASTLCRSLSRLKISIGLIPKSNYSTLQQTGSPGSKFSCVIPLVDPKACQSQSFSPALSSLDLNIRHPGLVPQIIDSPLLDRRNEVSNPRKIIDQVENQEPAPVELPALDESLRIEKQAARLIVIRRHKMKKHKKRKLKKKMKFLWRKLKFRKALKKEKQFHKQLLGQIRKAENFDPEKYVQKRLAILDHVRIPSVWKSVVLPEEMVRQFMKEEEEQKMKIANRPRLTLD